MIRLGLLLLAMALMASASSAAHAQTLPDSLGAASIRRVDSDERARAIVPLGEIIEQAEDRLGSTSVEVPDDATIGFDPRAARLYARGRFLLLSGQPAPAVSALRRATELAPDSPGAWRELGMAQMSINDRASATTSLEKAVSLGAGDPRLLYVLGSLDLTGRRTESGIDRLALATNRIPSAQDGALPAIIHVALGEVLHASGWIRAGNEAIERGVRNIDRVRNRSMYDNELARLYPRRARLMRVVGDNWLRLDEPGRAADAYHAAWGLGVHINDAVVAKHIYALAVDGRGGEAVDRLIEAFGDHAGRLDDRLIETLAMLDDPSRRDAAGRLERMLEEPWVDRTVRSWLNRARAAALGGEAGRDVLRAWLEASPMDTLALGDLLATHDDATSLASEMRGLAQSHPLLALESGRIVARTLGQNDDVLDVLAQAEAQSKDESARIARVSLLLALNRPAEALEGLGELGDDGTIGLALNAMALDAMGRLELARKTLDRMDADGSARDRLTRAWALHAMQRSALGATTALELADEPGGDRTGERIDAMVFWLRVAPRDMLRTRGQEIARRVLALDPSNLVAIEALIRESPESGGALLRERGGGSRLRRLFAGERTLAMGNRNDGELSLTMLALGGEKSDRAIDLLASIWLSARGIEREISLERGVALLDRLLVRRAGDIPLVIARARLLEALGRREDALDSLRDAEALGAAVRRELEDMMLRDPGLAEAGRALRDARLGSGDLTVAERVERAAELVDRREVERAARLLSARALDGVSLTVAQSGRLTPSLRRLGARVSREPEGDERDATIALLDRLIGLDATLGAPLHELRLALLATLQPLETDRIARATRDTALWLGPGLVDATVLAPVRYLGGERRLGEALELIEAITGEIPLRESEGVELWIRLVMSQGGSRSLRLLLERVRDDAPLRAFTQAVRRPVEELAGGALRGEVAFIVGVQHAGAGREQDALADYEIGLEYDPRHPWCANNLGYSLLERGLEIERAERLIEIAHEQLPDDDIILDSLGWARYMRGQMHDEPGLDGHEPRLGAVTLLERAVELGAEQPGEVVLDHLGDALWRGEEHERAIESWQRALATTREQVAELGGELGENHPALVELRTMEDTLSAKIDAGGSGGEPLVAPLGAGQSVRQE